MVSTNPPTGDAALRRLDLAGDDVDRIVGALRGLRYGAVTVIVQDGVIVQVERTEKLRVSRRAAGAA
ncbi:MAG TPA: YezD family protein [Candidatus Binatia bacterium]|nr:YezD family protein [Candidatus Binatia bacterium]